MVDGHIEDSLQPEGAEGRFQRQMPWCVCEVDSTATTATAKTLRNTGALERGCQRWSQSLAFEQHVGALDVVAAV